MSLGPWFYVLLIGIGGLHLLVALLVVRFESGRTINRAGSGTSTDNRVTCDECGASNDVGYRYCRQCVAELPSRISADQAGTATAGREIF